MRVYSIKNTMPILSKIFFSYDLDHCGNVNEKCVVFLYNTSLWDIFTIPSANKDSSSFINISFSTRKHHVYRVSTLTDHCFFFEIILYIIFINITYLNFNINIIKYKRRHWIYKSIFKRFQNFLAIVHLYCVPSTTFS